MRVTAKVDYAVRAALELAGADGGPLKGEEISAAQDIPINFLENILGELRNARIVRTQRGPSGGYWLTRPADEITIGEIIRAVEGPLASVRGQPPETVEYDGPASALQTLWIALRSNLRAVLDEATLAQVADDSLPAKIERLTELPGAWSRR